MKSTNNFPLRFINSNVGEPMSEKELQESERRIEIIRDNQKYTGVQDYPDIQKSLKDAGDSLIHFSENKEMCLANTLSGLQTIKSIIEFNIEKLRIEYKKEGEKLKEIIENK